MLWGCKQVTPTLKWSGSFPTGRDVSWDIRNKKELVKGSVGGKVHQAEEITCSKAPKWKCIKIRNNFNKFETV